MDIREATEQFEAWLGQRVKLNDDIKKKHEEMHEDTFQFLRATYYRWAQQFAELEKKINNAPEVLAVGDLHIENFGTWRDNLGRLAWGVNDFDEAFHLPYTNDLVRLAASGIISGDVDVESEEICASIIEGYREGLRAGGKPFVVGDQKKWAKPIIHELMQDPDEYWDKLFKLKKAHNVPEEAHAAIRELMPKPTPEYEVFHRNAGLGSKGKPRFTAIAQWLGGPLAREAKALTQSAAAWALGKSKPPQFTQIIAQSIRSHDPFLIVHGDWIVRRLAADCRRINLGELKDAQAQAWLLREMGFETANVHLGTGKSADILKHLSGLPGDWLMETAKEMIAHVEKDFEKFQ